MKSLDLPELASAFASAPGAMLAAILDQSADCIKVIGVDGSVDYMNRNGQCAMEVDDFCAIAGQQWSALWPADARQLIDGAMVMARRGETAQFEAFCPTAKGSPRWWEVSVSPLRSPGGSIEGFIATSRDVTERVHRSALRDAVADEMRHRLRNNYVVVGSLLSAYSRGKPEQRAFVSEMIGRLNSLGIAQTMTASADKTCRLIDLAPALLEPYATPDCPIEIGAIPDVSLGQAQVDALALLLGELAVNSTKHGALSAVGVVKVAFAVEDDRVAIDWSERSNRAVVNHARAGGQGLALMHRVLASRAGTIGVDWFDDGLDVRATMALG